MNGDVVLGLVHTGIYGAITALLIALSIRTVRVTEVCLRFYGDTAPGRELTRQARSERILSTAQERETLQRLVVTSHLSHALHRVLVVMAFGAPVAVWLSYLSFGRGPWLRLFMIGIAPVILLPLPMVLLALRSAKLARQ